MHCYGALSRVFFFLILDRPTPGQEKQEDCQPLGEAVGSYKSPGRWPSNSEGCTEYREGILNQSITRRHKFPIGGTRSGRSNEICPESLGQDQSIIIRLDGATLAIGFLRVPSANAEGL